MSIEITKEELLKIIDKELLAENIANKIVQRKTDSRWNEFDGELLKGLKVGVEKIIKEYIENYYEKSGIEREVKEVLSKMTREDIIRSLNNKQ